LNGRILRFEFATATKIVFGPGVLREAGKIAGEFGQRALVVTGSNLHRAEPLLLLLRSHDVEATVFPVEGEPEVETVRKGVALARQKGCELVLSFGGGSPIDAGKAIAAMMRNEGELLDYLEIIGKGKALNSPAAPFVAIPTTAGTGSEVTRNAVLASAEHKLKVSLRSPFMLPKVALVDPELTYDLPPSLTASTGLDALTQLIEPYVCSRSTPLTDALCVEGIGRVARSILLAFKSGVQASSAREDMALASLFGGLALANAGLGAVHGFAGPIGGMFTAPHGAVCAALLPAVMEINLRALWERQSEHPALQRYTQVAQLLTGDSTAQAEAGVRWVRQLVSDFQVPRLNAYGIGSEDVDELVSKAQNASSMKANPIELNPGELRDALKAAL